MANSIRDVARQAGLRSGVAIVEGTIRLWINRGLLTGDLSDELVTHAAIIASLRHNGFTVEEIARFRQGNASVIGA